MTPRTLLGLFLAAAMTAPAQAQPASRRFEDVVISARAKFEPAQAPRGATVAWTFTLELAPEWHTYPTRQPDEKASSYVTRITRPEPTDIAFLGEVTEPPNPVKKPLPEEDILEMHSYENTATWRIQAVISPQAAPGPRTIKVPVRVLVCDDKGCLPPKNLVLEAPLTILDGPAQPLDPKYAGLFKTAPPTSPKADPPSAVSAGPAPVETPASGDVARGLDRIASGIQLGDRSVTPQNAGLPGFLLTAALWGLISLITPCVFPMIPITVSFFLKQSEKANLNPLLQATVYSATIVIVLGVAALTLLGTFRELSVHPWTNIALGLLFLVLALSLLGMFEITLPNFLTRFTSSREGQGGLLGTVFMALTFTIVSFTCVAPFLGGFAGIASSGQFRWWEMLLGALAFSTAFAAPFFVLALFPSLLRKLPRSGGWLNTIKVIMGFLEIAAALKFFRTAELRLLPQPQFFTYDFVLALWVALCALAGFYLVQGFRFDHDEPEEHISVPRFFLGLLFLGLGVYMAPALFKTGPDATPNRPNGAIFAWIDAFLLPEATPHSAAASHWSADLPKALEMARAARASGGTPSLVFVDFTGVTCTNCKYNERTVFSRPDVQELFRSYRLVQMYTDEVPIEFYKTKPDAGQREADAVANLAFQKKLFGTEQLPLYVILEPLANGQTRVVDVYLEGKINNPENFLAFLRGPLEGRKPGGNAPGG